MAKEVIGAEVSIDYSSIGALRRQLKEATGDVIALSAKFGDTSKEAIMAAQKVAKLKDAIGDAKSLVDAFNPDRKFAAVGQAINGITGGFAALQGAIGLMGVKSEEVEKQLLKVQSALALTQGLDNVRESIQGFKNLGAVISQNVVKAFSTLRGAIMATGIGALVVGLGLLIANFDKIKNAIRGLNPEIDENIKKTALLSKTLEAESKIFNKKLELLKLQGVGEKELTRLKIEETKKRLKATQSEMMAQQALLNQLFESLGKESKLISTLANLPGGASLAEFLVGKFGSGDEILKTQEKIKDFSTTIADLDIQIKILEEEQKKKTEAKVSSVKPKEKGAVIGSNDLTIVDAQQAEFDARNEIADDFQDKEDERLKRDIERQNAGLANQAAAFQSIRDNKEAQLKYDEAIEHQKLALYQSSANALVALSGVVGEQTAAGKALAIAAALINTYLGITQGVKLGFPAMIPAIIAASAAGFAAVKNIIKTKVPGKETSFSSVNLSSAAPLQAALSPQAQSNALNSQAINNLASTPSRAYILNRDIQNNGQINNYLQRNSSIG